jgi:XTP/dITP diphosphohydrolase
MTLYFATTNTGKFKEAVAKLAPIRIMRFNLPYPEVQAATLEEVVNFALEWMEGQTDKDVMLEDSGLFIDALNGFPGVFSSQAFRSIGNSGILKLMEGASERKARFQTCIGLLMKGKKWTFKGEVEGTIAMKPKGTGGFGFDPIFIPYGLKETFAQMPLKKKNNISHRAKAIERLLEFLEPAKGI